jgi:PAS domain-containing protein
MPGDDVLALIDEGGWVVEWGRPTEELFEWPAEEAVGQSVTMLLREVATDDDWRRERFSKTAAALVKPVPRGTSVMWQVIATEDAVSGRTRRS